MISSGLAKKGGVFLFKTEHIDSFFAQIHHDVVLYDDKK